ncbi:MAG: secondary thiamine-phosphate synthase enzyme YjbQ [Paracoccaceae bacterium]|nr:secondary thiamine-phosphate synthase [Marinovum sp.]MCH1562468.1 secondary thiamine-phosphate synthase enzyme YjbQ [Paracoccaceae bacterium]NCV18499.1 YjbQ family protein [Rhodobacterales bacterium]MAK79488.1 secondary thiamine-phosphate synthase [Marinovum sp.]NCX69265.1 YjbQ family protein [Paracoccaceae bacterium]
MAKLKKIVINTKGSGLYEFTDDLKSWVFGDGILHLFVKHTSASLLIQENFDPEVKTDLNNFFQRLVPLSSDPSMSYLTHRYEGEDDMPAHIKASLGQVSLTIPVIKGELALGSWQGIYLFEHRKAPKIREVVAKLQSDI